jgi:hypothetical protein
VAFRKYFVLLFIPQGLRRPDDPAKLPCMYCTKSKVDAADPCKISHARLALETTGLCLVICAALSSIRSLRRGRIRCVGVSRSGIWGQDDGSTARVPATSTVHFLDCAAPGANVANRVSCEWGLVQI